MERISLFCDICGNDLEEGDTNNTCKKCINNIKIESAYIDDVKRLARSLNPINTDGKKKSFDELSDDLGWKRSNHSRRLHEHRYGK